MQYPQCFHLMFYLQAMLNNVYTQDVKNIRKYNPLLEHWLPKITHGDADNVWKATISI